MKNSWNERALKVLPGGVNSPVRAFRHVGQSPLYFARGEGAFLFDIEGNAYVDLCMGFGPLLFGHSPKSVVAAVCEQAEIGTSWGACHPVEVQVAEALLSSYPFLQKARLVNSGTEAVMTALRIARSATGRDKFIKFDGCYHGHADPFLVKSGSGLADLVESSSAGVPKNSISDTLIASWNDLPALEKVLKERGHEIAALIFEAVPANHGLFKPAAEDLQRIVALAQSKGVVAIADEVITGFRLGPHGACGYFDIQPDLVTLGKVIGGGFPLAAVLGKAELMDQLAPIGPAYQAGTYAGNILSSVAGLNTLKKIRSEEPYENLRETTLWFTDNLKEVLSVAGFDFEIRTLESIFWIYFNPEGSGFPPVISEKSADTYRQFFASALEAGIYLPPSPYEVCFLSTEHSREILGTSLERLCTSLSKSAT